MAKSENVKYYGILASLDWNSNKWQDLPTSEDLKNSKFSYVAEHKVSFTALNFAQDLYPPIEGDNYYGLVPHLWSKTLDKEKSKYVKVVFFKSHNWEDNKTYIVGLYAFQKFDKRKIPSPIPALRMEFDANISALPKNICLLSKFINLNNHPDLKRFLPVGKELGKMGFNYLTKENVFKILDTITLANAADKKLNGIKFRLLTSI